MCDTLVVPTTILSDADLNHCIAVYISLQQHQVPHETFKELSKQGKLLKDLLQRIILTARFEDATPPESKIIHMLIAGLNNAVTYVMFDGHRHPRFKLDCSPWYPGMTADDNIKQHYYSPIFI